MGGYIICSLLIGTFFKGLKDRSKNLLQKGISCHLQLVFHTRALIPVLVNIAMNIDGLSSFGKSTFNLNLLPCIYFKKGDIYKTKYKFPHLS